MNPASVFRLAQGVAVRPERFGGLIYEQRSRRLLFLNSPDLTALLGELDGERPLAQVLDSYLEKRALPASAGATLLCQLADLARRDLVVAA